MRLVQERYNNAKITSTYLYHTKNNSTRNNCMVPYIDSKLCQKTNTQDLLEYATIDVALKILIV